MRSVSRHTLVVAVIVASSSGCARTLPADASSANLYRDLRRIVSVSQTTGWRIDRDEVRIVLPRALMSMCRVAPEQRAKLGPWLDRRMDALGGPPQKAWRARGKKLSAIADLLELHRVRLVYRKALADAPTDCPFHIEPRGRFDGRQIADDRWLLSFGGGGKLIGLNQSGDNDFSFGGAGRFLIGRSFGSRLTLFSGFEFGGSAAFPLGPNGERGSLIIAFDSLVPLVSRFRFLNSYIEVEGAYLFRFTEDDPTLLPGVHVAVTFGARATRQHWFLPGAVFPGAGFSVAYERIFSRGSRAPINMIKIGFRAAFDVQF